MTRKKAKEECEYYSGTCGMQFECESCPLYQDKELLSMGPDEDTRGLFVQTAMHDIGLTQDEAEREFDEFAGCVDW